MGAVQFRVLADEVDQQQARLDVVRVHLPVDGDGNEHLFS
jgi:hypothetical protein